MKKLSEPVQKVNCQVVGLDVHKHNTVYCVLDANGRTVRRGDFRSRPVELEAFVREILEAGDTHFAFEASRSSWWVHRVIESAVGAERIHVAQAKKIRAIANSNHKNDGNDACWLAYLTYEGRVPEAYVPSAELLELRIATRERIHAVRRRTCIINRLKGHLAQVGEVVPGSSIRTEQARLFMMQKALLVEGSRGRAIRLCLDELDYQEATIKEWEQVIERLSQTLPEVRLIEKTMPGFGPQLAPVVVAESGDLTRFASAKAYGCFTGLTPADKSTGGKVIHGAMTREGSSYLRWALTQAVMGCLRSRRGPGLAVGDWVRAKQARMGIKAKARAAGARKLAEGIWRLFNYGETFDPGRPFGSPRAVTT
jgi:transposase